MNAELWDEHSVADFGVHLLLVAIERVFEESQCFSALSGVLPQSRRVTFQIEAFLPEDSLESVFSCIFFCS